MKRRTPGRRSSRVLLMAVLSAIVAAIAVLGSGALPAAADDQPPVVTSISPTSGPAAGGTSASITGSGFTGVTAVTFGSTAASSFTFNGDTSITAVSPVGTATVDVTVTTSVSTSATSNVDKFTYIAAPIISGISPTSGSDIGGNTVTITGTNLTGATEVDFGTSVVTPSSTTPTTVTAIAPAQTAGPVNLVVKTPGGTSNPAVYTYTTMSAPTVTGLTPDHGAGSTQVDISGTNFPTTGYCGSGGTAQVYFGTTLAASCNLSTGSNLIYAVAPAGTGSVDVTVTTAGGTSATSANDVFNYGSTGSALIISSVSPGSGPVGTVLTITGSNLTPSSVTVGGVNCPLITATSTQLTCTTQGGTALNTSLDVVVSTPTHGSATDYSAFTYTAGGPVSVTSVSPNSCPLAGGNTLYVYGAGFVLGSTTVRVNNVLASDVNVLSSGQLTVTCPAQTYTGTYDLIVTVGNLSSANTVNDNVTYTTTGVAPVITDVQPSSGSVNGGTLVTITGSNFTSPANVTFDGIPATSVTVVSSTRITAITPAHTGTGLVDVVVSTSGGSDVDIYGFTYTSTASPVVTGLSPTSGPTGTHVTITGSNFTGATKVTFGGVSASFTIIGSGTIAATVPAGTSTGVVDVIVTTPAGTSANTSADNFTNTTSNLLTVTLQNRFTLIGWVGVDGISVADALRGGPDGPQGGTNDITSKVSAVWGFNTATQTWEGYFPSSDFPGASDLQTLQSGSGYFIALSDPAQVVEWTFLVA